MIRIYRQTSKVAKDYGFEGDLVRGANSPDSLKLPMPWMAQGIAPKLIPIKHNHTMQGNHQLQLYNKI